MGLELGPQAELDRHMGAGETQIEGVKRETRQRAVAAPWDEDPSAAQGGQGHEEPQRAFKGGPEINRTKVKGKVSG